MTSHDTSFPAQEVTQVVIEVQLHNYMHTRADKITYLHWQPDKWSKQTQLEGPWNQLHSISPAEERRASKYK